MASRRRVRQSRCRGLDCAMRGWVVLGEAVACGAAFALGRWLAAPEPRFPPPAIAEILAPFADCAPHRIADMRAATQRLRDEVDAASIHRETWLAEHGREVTYEAETDLSLLEPARVEAAMHEL